MCPTRFVRTCFVKVDEPASGYLEDFLKPDDGARLETVVIVYCAHHLEWSFRW